MGRIVSYGEMFDGKCAYCRDWIKPTDPNYTQAVPNESGHTITHAVCSIYGPVPPFHR